MHDHKCLKWNKEVLQRHYAYYHYLAIYQCKIGKALALTLTTLHPMVQSHGQTISFTLGALFARLHTPHAFVSFWSSLGGEQEG